MVETKFKKKNPEKDYPVFVETGTFKGGTILPLENYFSELHTIEICEKLFDNVKNKSKKINFHLGDSSKILAEICPKINFNTIFFLDGHWSCGSTGRGEKDCPLYEELVCIMSLLNHYCIIIIDDCRLFGKGPTNSHYPHDWEDINVKKILNLVHPRIDKYYFCPSNLHAKDRLVIYLHK